MQEQQMDRSYSFGYWLRRRRKALDLTQEELARRAGCVATTIKKIEADARRPSKQLAEILADVLAIPAEEQPAFLQAARAERNVEELAIGISARTLAAVAAPPTVSATTALPTGTVTFLFTDIEGSTQLWEHYPAAMSTALARHDAILNQQVVAHAGTVFKTVGDAFHAVFATAADALGAALAAQRALAAEVWGESGPLRVRMALHTGTTELRDGDYFGPTLNRTARLLAAGHGQQVLLSLSAAELAREHLPLGSELCDLGLHRLKDLSLPERIFQLLAVGLPTEFPPLRTLNPRRTNLPVPLTELIGREHEITDVSALLRKTKVRLVTLTGPGGIGKTRISLQVAAKVSADFADGVYFVDLAPLRDANLVATTIAHTLGVRESSVQPLFERLKDYLREKTMLLVLDNFEQLLEAATVVAELLAVAGQLKMLITSRERLHLRGEKEISVQPLGLPDPGHLPTLEQLSQYTAVQLFIERAIDVRADFEVTNANAPVVAEICVRLDGLPLAIELAAARTKLFPPEALLARLNSRLALLSGGARDLPRRQQALRATTAWSYDLLEGHEQALFRRLGVFAGGCTVEAIETICAMPEQAAFDSIEGVTALVDKSLLRQTGVLVGEPRVKMLETIREYALEQLERSGEETSIRHQHAAYYLALVEAAEPLLRTTEQESWLDRLEEEHNNIQVALQWFSAGGDIEASLRLAGALWQFWAIRGHVNEGIACLKSQLALAEQAPEAHGGVSVGSRAKASFAVGMLSHIQGDWYATRSALEASVMLFRMTQEPWALARALGFLGIMNLLGWHTGDDTCEESAALFDQIGERWGCAFGLVCRGIAAASRDEPAARTVGVQGARMLRELGDKWSAAFLFHKLWDATRGERDAEWALPLVAESEVLFRELGDTIGATGSLKKLADAARWHGDYERAAALYDECAAQYRELGLQLDLAAVLHGRGMVAYQQRDDRRAMALFESSIAIFREAGQSYAIGWCLMGIAGIAARTGADGARRAARLLAADDRLNNPLDNYGPEPLREWQSIAAATRGQLDEATWAAAWAEGQVLTLDQAIAYALEGDTHEPNVRLFGRLTH